MNRDISPFLQMLRRFFLKRENVNMLRFPNEISRRTQPPPNLPEGPHAKLGGNYYYTRDARRLVKPEEVIYEGTTVLKLPDDASQTYGKGPGKIHNWDL